MAVLDGPLGRVATSLGKALGGTGTLTLESAGTYNPPTGSATPTETVFSVRPMPGGRDELRMFAGSLVQQGDRTCVIAASEVTTQPRPGSAKLSWLGKTWRVEGVEPITTGDADAAYVLLLRR